MKNKLMLLVLSTFILLTGCGDKTPTAEELIDNIGVGIVGDEAFMDMKASTKMSGETVGEGLSADISTNIEMSIKFDEDTILTETKAEGMLLSTTQTWNTKTYMQDEGNGIVSYYTWNDSDSVWKVERLEEKFETDGNLLGGIASSLFEDLEVKQTDYQYIVTGKMHLGDPASMSDNIITTLYATSGLTDVDLDVELGFSKETKKLRTFKAKASEASTTGLKLDNYELYVEIIDSGAEGDVTIPQEALDNATLKTDEPKTEESSTEELEYVPEDNPAPIFEEWQLPYTDVIDTFFGDEDVNWSSSEESLGGTAYLGTVYFDMHFMKLSDEEAAKEQWLINEDSADVDSTILNGGDAVIAWQNKEAPYSTVYTTYVGDVVATFIVSDMEEGDPVEILEKLNSLLTALSLSEVS